MFEGQLSIKFFHHCRLGNSDFTLWGRSQHSYALLGPFHQGGVQQRFRPVLVSTGG